jgi:DNA polymerase-1|tara:strand:- start:1242 stop:2231 length:990 start_codon:yes stop_codon:yes gene_type:complete
MTTALVDADIVAFKAAAKTMDRFDGELIGDPKTAIREAELILESWIRPVKATTVVLCWSCPTRKYFRHDIYPEYKGNRGGEKPPTLGAVIEHLKNKYKSVWYAGLEADDVLGILSGNPDVPDPVVISIDKDMLTLPTKFYNPDKYTRPIRNNVGMADRLMFKQALMGDSTDFYKGVPGCGNVKSDKILDSARPSNMWPTVLQTFLDANLTESYAMTMVRLARILRFEDYNFETGEVRLWHPTQPIMMKPSALNTTSSTTGSKPLITSLESVPNLKETKQPSLPTSSNTSVDIVEKEPPNETSQKPRGISKGSKTKSTKKKGAQRNANTA